MVKSKGFDIVVKEERDKNEKIDLGFKILDTDEWSIFTLHLYLY